MTPGSSESLPRRSFLAGSALALAAGPSLAASVPFTAKDEPGRPAKVIDAHAHLFHRSRADWAEADRSVIAAADALGIDQLCCSILTPKRPSTAEGFRECNRWVLEATRRFPGRVLGYCYVNPGHGREAVDEVTRCVEEHGFIGVKLYNEFRCTDPVVFPVIERAITLKVPILHHAGHLHYKLDDQPNISDGADLAALAKRYPEAMLICAHICGGGDWEWTIKALRHARTVSLDLSGSVADDGVIEMALKVLGPDRLLFACDMSFTASVGRIRSANLAPEDRRKILGDNMGRLLGRRRA